MASKAPPLLCALLLFSSLSLPCLCWTTLNPPAGNSLSLKTKTANGAQCYRCVDGDWILESSFATLVDFYDSGKTVGNYSWTKDPWSPRNAGTWSLFNNPGDSAESGSESSLVTGKKVYVAKPASPHDLSDYLAMATKHEFQGEASMVAYITRVNTDGGVPLRNGYCEYDHKLIKLPFQAEFHFWKQDLVPPNTPSSLAVVSDRAVQGFFGQGHVTYEFDGNQWNQKSTTAKLYDLPGGTQKGSYFIKGVADYKGGSFCWRFDGPNGFEIVGKHACKPVQVTPGCLPWSLNVVTTSNSKSPMFGPYSHVQMVSTTGGLPPANTAWKPKKGQTWISSYTALFWIYCKGSS